MLSGAAPCIPIQQAAKLEDVLGVPHGTFFVLDDLETSGDIIGPYLVGPDVDDHEIDRTGVA